MTEATKSRIREFSKSKKLTDIPYILLSMQEEDRVSEVIRYKNCFRTLRNIAAHEPGVIVEQIVSKENEGNQKIIFVTMDENKVVCDMLQFAVWMMDMFILTDNIEYLRFLKVLYQILYTKSIQKFFGTEEFRFKIIKETGLITSYVNWVDYMYDHFGIIKPIAIRDPYITKLYDSNKKVFWKVAVPDMMNLACFYMSGHVNLLDKINLKYFCMLYTVREGGEL